MQKLPSITLYATLLVLGLAACQAAPTVEENWQVLFDGTSLDAWRNYRAESVGDNWALIDGELVCTGGGGDLVTRDQFGDFIFEFEWKVSALANSGIMYQVSEEHGASYFSGPEYQVIDNAVVGDGDKRHSASANYALHSPAEDFTKPVGEWNQGRIEVEGKSVRHWLNGQLSVQFMRWTPEWESAVKASKFDQWPAYGRSPSGHIVLQDHGDRVSYRNLRVRRL